MARIRGLLVVALLVLALPFASAAAAADEPGTGTGDASTGLLAVDLRLDDADGLLVGGLADLLEGLDVPGAALDLGLIEATTFATTRDAPDAGISLSPLRLDENRPADVTLGPGEGTDGAQVDESTPLADVTILPFAAEAEADADGARALIEALTAQVEALGAAALEATATDVTSEVTATGAAAGQGLEVADLEIALGDLLPAELLELLPVDVLADLLDQLGLGDGLGDALDAAIDEVGDAAADVEALDLQLSAIDEVDEDLVDDLLGLLGAEEDLEDLLDDLDGGVLGELIDGLDDVLDDLGAAIATDLLDLAPSCDLDAPDADDLEACITELLSLVDELEGDLEGQLEDVAGLVLELADALDGLEEALEALLGVIDGILDGVDDLAGVSLLAVDTLALEVAADADAAGGATTIACDLLGVEVLGQAVADLDCTDLGVLDDLDARLAPVRALVADVFAALPGVDGLDGLRLELLPQVHEEVSTDDDGTTTATAHVVLLELVVPSVTIDPAAVGGVLDDLLVQLDDLLDDLDGLAALDDEIDDLLALVDGTGIEGILEDVQEAADEVVALVTGVLDDLRAQLELPDLGDTTVRTPSLSLTIDPVSEASFTPAPADDPTPDEPTEDDDPGDDPLPDTGGSMALLLAMLAIGGAAWLRRGES